MNKTQGMFGSKDWIYLIILLAITLAITCWFNTAPPPGWCVEQKRVLSEKEVIELAGVYTAERSSQKVIGGKLSPPLFCYIQRIKGGFWSKMIRMDEGVSMSWWYERSEEDRQKFNSNDKYYQLDRTVNSCVTENIYQSNNTTDSLPEKNSLLTDNQWNHSMSGK